MNVYISYIIDETTPFLFKLKQSGQTPVMVSRKEYFLGYGQ